MSYFSDAYSRHFAPSHNPGTQQGRIEQLRGDVQDAPEDGQGYSTSEKVVDSRRVELLLTQAVLTMDRYVC